MGQLGQSTSEHGADLSRAGEYGRAIGVLLLTTLASFVVRPHLATIDVAMLYLLAVVFIASRYSQGPAVLASVLGVALFDFLFVPPYYTLDVDDTRYILTFVVMLAVSLTITRLTARLHEQAEAARAGERRMAAVYAMDRDLRRAATRPDVLATAGRHLAQVVGGEAAIALVDERPAPGSAPAWPINGVFDDVAVRVAASWAYDQGESAGNGTRHAAEAEALVVPLRTPAGRLGVAVARPAPPERRIEVDERRTVEALAELLAAELGRTAWTRTPA